LEAGGGAGGFRTFRNFTFIFTAQAYTVTVGAGGAVNKKGQWKGDSVFSSITSTGGGGGGEETILAVML
jgi:hypothetical protein